MQSLGQFAATDRIDDPILMVGVQGPFHGTILPAAQIEALIAAHVPRNQIRDVADVYATRWWDYRRLSPGHSFFLFAHHYYRSVRFAARRVISERAAEHGYNKGAKSKALLGSSLIQMDVKDVWERDQGHITGLWKAMLVADAFGIPYPEFSRLACKIAIERLWKRLPRPSQLYSEKLAAYVVDEWEQMQVGRLFQAKHPLYDAANYAGLDVQDEYREWLIAALRRNDNLVSALMSAIYTTPQLPEAIALQHFPAASINRARLLAA